MRVNWSGIPSSSFLGKFLRFPLRLLPKRMAVRVRGGINQGMKWIVGSSTHGCWLGTYEIDKQQSLRRYVREGMTVFDIGAHSGFYSLAFSRLTGEHGKVWAFEPIAAKAAYLLRHLRLNRIGNVCLIQAAVSDRHGIVSLQADLDNAGYESMGSVVRQSRYQVPKVSRDELIAAGELPVPDIVKMDIEGSEAKALKGARRLLAGGKTTWFIAMHGAEQRRLCREILQSSGYRIFHFDGREHREHVLDDDEIVAVPATASRV